MTYPAVLLSLFSATVVLSTACVSKSKYLDAVALVQTTRTEADLLRDDLTAANQRSLRLRERIEEVEADMQAIREQTQQTRSQSISQQQELGDQLKTDRERIAALTEERNRLRRLLTPIRDALAARERRLREVRGRLTTSLGSLPEGQLRFEQSDRTVTAYIDAGTLFGPRGSTSLSPLGDQVVGQLASALGGQMDLAIEVVAYPSTAALGTAAAWRQASTRADAIATALVEGRGLLPRLVSAVGREGDVVILDGVPAEANTAREVAIRVMLTDTALQLALKPVER